MLLCFSSLSASYSVLSSLFHYIFTNMSVLLRYFCSVMFVLLLVLGKIGVIQVKRARANHKRSRTRFV